MHRRSSGSGSARPTCTALLYCPGSHAEHCDAAALAANWPPGHAVHAAECKYKPTQNYSRTEMPDCYLTPDELWTPSCNLFHDFISLQDIDPHLMLVVFLPALLFESATFGIDMGIFR